MEIRRLMPEFVGTTTPSDRPPDGLKKEGAGADGSRSDADRTYKAGQFFGEDSPSIAQRHPIIATHWGFET